MFKYFSIKTIICLAILCLIFCGCEEQTKSPSRPHIVTKKIVRPKTALQTDKKNKTEQVKPNVVASAPDTDWLPDMTDIYDSEGKIDPFVSLFTDRPIEESTKKKEHDYELSSVEMHLTKIDLSQLKLVGIISAEDGNKALVEEVSGKGYVIKKGMFIGVNSGRIEEILKDKVVVKEESENIFGKVSIKERELNFQKPSGER